MASLDHLKSTQKTHCIYVTVLHRFWDIRPYHFHTVRDCNIEKFLSINAVFKIIAS